MSDPQRLGRQEFLDELEAELLAAHGRRRPRRRPSWRAPALVAAALLALVAVVTVVVGLDTREAEASPVRVETGPDGTATVTVLEPGAPADEIEAALAESGIRAEVQRAPTGPSLVGDLVRVVGDAPGIPPAERGSRSFVIPPGYDGTITVAIGVAADPGEPYEELTDPFAPGEPLANVPEADRSDAAAVLLAAGAADLAVDQLGPDGPGPAPPGAALVAAAMTASDRLLLRWAPPG